MNPELEPNEETTLHQSCDLAPDMQTEAAEEAAEHDAPALQTVPERVRMVATQTPSADQLTTSRAAQWHQAGDPILSIERLREWLQRSGLVLYTPKPQLGAPAPSLVEATLGASNAAPQLAEMDAARNLMARLTSEGNAVPLNLLGATGATGTDVPDFVVSAAVFSYIFTLRGNKAWKQSPATSGAVKVSPLALAAYEVLLAKVTLSAYDLTTQLGKEVTETAVLRALTELWSQLRVIPIWQQDGSATLWELTTSRFTKQIKAGANAGQPSALSALVSLYLGQAVVATEDEIESFLSPLAPRSRVRDVVHALMAARQLGTIVISGKTLLHVTGDLPEFAAKPEAVGIKDAQVEGDGQGSRIGKLAARPGSKIGTGLRARPSSDRPAYGKKPGFGGGKPAYSAKPVFGGGADRDRRPFKREGGGATGGFSKPSFSKPTFSKPWDEDRAARPARPAALSASGEEAAAPRSYQRPEAGAERPPRREFTPRPQGGGEGERRTFSKPGTFGRKREGFAAKPGFDRGEGRPPRRDFAAGDSRPPRRDFAASAGDARPPRSENADRGERPAGGGFKRPGSYSPRPSGGGFGGGRTGSGGERSRGGGEHSESRTPFGARPSGPRTYGAKPFGAGPAGGRPARPERAEGGEAPRKVFRKFDAPRGPRPAGDRPNGDRPAFGGKPSFGAKSSFGGKPSFGKKPAFGARPSRPFDAERPPRKFDGPRTEGHSAGGERASGFAGKKPGGFAAAGGPFAKFADGKRPFRKPGAPRKPTGSGGGGFAPTRRPRPEGGR